MNVKPTMIKLCYTYEKLKSKHEGENKKALQPDKIVEYNDSERNAISIDKADEVIEIETHFRGKYIVLINREETLADGLGDVVFHESIGDVLDEIRCD